MSSSAPDLQRELPVQTFMEYTEYDLYSSEQMSVKVPSRDPLAIDFKKLDWWAAPTFLGFPTEFKFYDAEVDAAGREIAGTRTNYSRDYQVAEIVMTIDAYIARETPKLDAYKKELRSRSGAFMDKLLDGGFNLKDSFKEAVAPKKPVMDWYIWQVEKTLADAAAVGATHIALWDAHDASPPIVVGDNLIVLDRTLKQLYPVAAKPAPSPLVPKP